MRHGAKAFPSDRIDEQPLLFEHGDEVSGRSAFVDDIEDDDVRFDMLGDQLDRGNLIQDARQFFGVVMIGLQP